MGDRKNAITSDGDEEPQELERTVSTAQSNIILPTEQKDFRSLSIVIWWLPVMRGTPGFLLVISIRRISMGYWQVVSCGWNRLTLQAERCESWQFCKYFIVYSWMLIVACLRRRWSIWWFQQTPEDKQKEYKCGLSHCTTPKLHFAPCLKFLAQTSWTNVNSCGLAWTSCIVPRLLTLFLGYMISTKRIKPSEQLSLYKQGAWSTVGGIMRCRKVTKGKDR